MDWNKWKDFWDSNDEKAWKDHEQEYSNAIQESNLALEQELEGFDINNVWKWEPTEFYEFLDKKYFVWKYTAKNRLSTTREKLKTITNPELSFIMKALKAFSEELSNMNGYDENTIKIGFNLITMIPGLGIAGTSGLLSILFPKYYGTVDQFVVKSLKEAGVKLSVRNPVSINLKGAIELEKIMYNKAQELNNRNGTSYWTPRKIDKVLWAHRSNDK